MQPFRVPQMVDLNSVMSRKPGEGTIEIPAAKRDWGGDLY